jgi:integrase
VTFVEYAQEWIATYQGRTYRGIRPETLADYRRDLGLEKDGGLIGDGAMAFFGRMTLAAIEPRDVKRYAAELAARGLAPGSVRNVLAPVRALLATAFEDGLIRSNPSAGLRIVQRVQAEAHEPRAKALTEEELRALLDEVPEEWRLFFELLAHTGVRIGEAVALTWADVDFGKRRLHVRRRLYRGRLDSPKSRYGRRVVPLTEGLAQALWRLRAESAGRYASVHHACRHISRRIERRCSRLEACR